MYKKTNTERIIRAVVLIDPNCDVSEIWNKENDEESEHQYLDKSQVVINEPILRQAYRALEEAKSVGLSGADLEKKLGIGKLTVRAVTKRLTKLKQVQYYIQDSGRQRVP